MHNNIWQNHFQNQNLENSPIWTAKFILEVLPLLDVRHCPILSSCGALRKTNDSNLIKSRKIKFKAQFLASKTLSSVVPLLVVRHWPNVMQYSMQFKEKLINQI